MAAIEPEATCAPRLERRPDGQLRVTTNDATTTVRISRCFPWSSPARFISLRDDDSEEIWLIENPSDLDADSRSALEDALIESDFVLEIVRIDDVEEEIEIRCWQVETAQGTRRFQTRRDEWPRVVPGGGVLIRDVAGDLFHVPKPDALDRKSRELLRIEG